MEQQRVREAIIEAEKFIKRAKLLLAVSKKSLVKETPEKYCDSGKEAAALKRTAIELGVMLVDMRKNRWS